MALPSVIRIRLDLRKVKVSIYPCLIWLSVDTSLIHTVQDLKKLILRRFNAIETGDVSLYCQDCYLPLDETIAIIRDEDLIQIHCKDQCTSLEEKCDTYSNCFPLPVEKEYRGAHKKRKQNRSDDIKDICSYSEIKRNKIEIAEINNNIGPEDTPKQRKKEKKHKKHKHRYSELESLGSKDIVADSSNLPVNSDSSSENTRKKAKKHKNSTEFRVFEANSDIVSPLSPLNSETKDSDFVTPLNLEPKDTAISLQTDPGFSTTVISVDKSNGRNIVGSIFQSQHEGPDKIPGNNCKKKRKRSRKRKSKLHNNSIEKTISDSEKPSKECFESSCKSSVEHTSFVPANKHVKFADVEENEGADRANFDEKSDNQNSSQADSLFNDKPSFVTSSPIVEPKNGIISNNPKSDENEKSLNSLINSMNLVTSIQSKYREFSKEKQLASVNTNRSTIYANTPENEYFNSEKKKTSIPVEKKDYKKYSHLKGPPRVGDVIAYKILELSADYCPQISDYKEGKVINYDEETDDIEVELTVTDNMEPKGKGKFDLPLIAGDHSSAGGTGDKSTVLVNWTAMIEPRLIS